MFRVLWVLLFVALVMIGTLGAQPTSPLENFTTSSANGNVYLSWVMTSGNTCNGIKILRSVDRIHFSQIGEIEGICGSIITRETYSFTDEMPVKNAINYYRLELGGNGNSAIVSIEITVTEVGEYQVRPHPITTDATIYFTNDSKVRVHFILSNAEGKEVMYATTDESFIRFSSAFLPSGPYYFQIFESDTKLTTSGKIVVQH